MIASARRGGSSRVFRISLPMQIARILACVLVLISTESFVSGSRADERLASNLEIHKGDHISLIGNTLADRMQHHGWLETGLQSRFPSLELTIRNLGYSADELTLRLRSASFGSQDEWLGRTRTDIVFAFFGYNESFGDLNEFRTDLSGFIDHTSAQKYNGSSAPRLVLFSPIAHENLRDRSLPAGKENNARLEQITAVMEEIARAHHVRFVDLYRPTRHLFDGAKRPYTINGIHLTSEGNRILATIIDHSLFPEGPMMKRDAQALEKLRQAVLEKNHYWFNRYRTVDGYSIYGGRADLRFTDGQTNRVVMQREMEVLDVMTANRDRRIWALARGKELEVDDRNTPPLHPGENQQAGKGAQWFAYLSGWRGGAQGDDSRQGTEG